MAQNYIDISDFTNVTFNKTSEQVRQHYIDVANEEIEDLANRVGITDISLIIIPIHYKIKQYAINFTYSLFSQDLIGANSVDIGEVDVYKDMFERSQYLINQLITDISIEMFTGDVKERSDRSISFGKLYRS